MAVLSTISVGDITYYTVDAVPTHTAPKGSVAILRSTTYENNFMWVNNNDGTVWLKVIKPAYGELLLTNGTTTVVADGDQTLGSWYAFNAVDTWNLGDADGFVKLGVDRLQYTNSALSRFYTRQEATLVAGSSKWIQWQIGVSKNFTVPSRHQGCFGNDNAATVHVAAQRIDQLVTSEFILGAISPVSREAGGGTTTRAYTPRHCQVTTLKIDEALATTLVNETWESASFTTNSWTTVNHTTNVWVVGTAQNNTSGGSHAAYISNDAGTTAAYTNTVANVSHFYRDFTFPSGVSSIVLTFDWKCQGENSTAANQYDYGTVVITTTGTTPVAGTEVTTSQGGGGTDGRYGASTNLGKFNLGYGTTPGTTWNTESIDLTAYAGQTKRIVFTWANDGSVGTNPPFIIDNIKLLSYTW